MRFSWVLMALTFMLLTNILYASLVLEKDFFSTQTVQIEDLECGELVSRERYCFRIAQQQGGYFDCVNILKQTSLLNSFCINYPLTFYIPEESDLYQELTGVGGVFNPNFFISSVSFILSVPFSNTYLLLINILCWVIIVIFIWEAISPASSTS